MFFPRQAGNIYLFLLEWSKISSHLAIQWDNRGWFWPSNFYLYLTTHKSNRIYLAQGYIRSHINNWYRISNSIIYSNVKCWMMATESGLFKTFTITVNLTLWLHYVHTIVPRKVHDMVDILLVGIPK